jgi:hypothetical protein
MLHPKALFARCRACSGNPPGVVFFHAAISEDPASEPDTFPAIGYYTSPPTNIAN